MSTVVLIPAYKPDEKLLSTIDSIYSKGLKNIIVINDGSGDGYDLLFLKAAEKHGIEVLKHGINLGKGRALKTAFNHMLLYYPGWNAVSCDADGQHPAEAVLAVADTMEINPGSLVLGVRRFFKARVPLLNLIGNTITRAVFFLLTGLWFGDTQCGLRGYTHPVIESLIPVKGERYEFESVSLLHARKKGIKIIEVPMDAVYIDNNQSSHFNKLLDSARIYASILPYAALPFISGLLIFLTTLYVSRIIPLAAAASVFSYMLSMRLHLGKAPDISRMY